MDPLEKIQVNREKADIKNTSIMKVLSKTLDATYKQILCYGDCESCVLGSKNDDECLGSEVSQLNKKIQKYINADDLEEEE